MASTWINGDTMLAELKERMNAEMLEAAEPVIRKAVEEAEKEMRKRLGGLFVAMIDASFSVYRDGRDLHITVRNDVPNKRG